VFYWEIFAANNDAGEIYVRRAIDRETHSAFQLIVTAEDAGPDSHPVDATVIVTVADVNDNRPSIVVNTLAAVGAERAAVPENAAPGTFVAHVTVVDPDAGRNGTVNCTLLGAGSARFFALEERSLLHQPETEYQVFLLFSFLSSYSHKSYFSRSFRAAALQLSGTRFLTRQFVRYVLVFPG